MCTYFVIVIQNLLTANNQAQRKTDEHSSIVNHSGVRDVFNGAKYTLKWRAGVPTERQQNEAAKHCILDLD